MKGFGKIISLLAFVPIFALAFTVPQYPTGFVNDYAQVMSTEEVNSLESKLVSFEKNTTNEISVVTIKSLDGDTIENVAQEIFTKWEIGKKDKNNGVLLLISIAEHKTRIHTGYGVEGDLTDIGTSYIQSDVIAPAFRSGDFYRGINGAVDKMIEALGGNNIVPAGYHHYEFNLKKINFNFSSGAFILVIFIFQIILSALARTKSWWGGGVLGGFVGLGLWHFFISSIFWAMPLIVSLIGFGLFFDFLVSKSYNNARTNNTYPWWMRGGGGGFGGGSSGGGFGGFGGGSSGGGGSSSSW